MAKNKLKLVANSPSPTPPHPTPPTTHISPPFSKGKNKKREINEENGGWVGVGGREAGREASHRNLPEKNMKNPAGIFRKKTKTTGGGRRWAVGGGKMAPINPAKRR